MTLGFALGVWAVSVPLIKNRLDLSYGQVGITLLTLGLSSLAAMSGSGRLMSRHGEFRVLLGGAALMVTALTVIAVARSWPALLVSMVVFGFGNGTFDAASNAVGVDLQRQFGRPIFSAFHGWFSVGGLVIAAGGAAALSGGLSVAWLLAGTAVLCAVTVAALAPALVSNARPETHGAGSSARPALLDRRIALLGVMAFAMLLAEGSANDWSSLFLRNVIDAPTATAALAFGAFSLTMLTMRLLGDRLVARFGAQKYWIVATSSATVGFAVIVASTNAPTAIVGWALAGAGIAGCIPIAFSAAGEHDPAHSSTYVSRVAALGYCGFLAGPSIIGFIAQATTLRVAMAVPAACCIGAAFAAGMFAPRRNETNPASASQSTPAQRVS